MALPALVWPVGLQLHKEQETTPIRNTVNTSTHGIGSVTKINGSQCPTVKGNGANVMLLSSWRYASPNIIPLPPPSSPWLSLGGYTVIL